METSEILDQQNQNRNAENKQQQGGAAEACWAHNPEVGRSKLPPAS